MPQAYEALAAFQVEPVVLQALVALAASQVEPAVPQA